MSHRHKAIEWHQRVQDGARLLNVFHVTKTLETDESFDFGFSETPIYEAILSSIHYVSYLWILGSQG